MSNNCWDWGLSCIDPGCPSDCQVNNFCLFASKEEREKWDEQSDRYLVEVMGGATLRFKSKTQLKFWLADAPYGEVYRVTTLPVQSEWIHKSGFGGDGNG